MKQAFEYLRQAFEHEIDIEQAIKDFKKEVHETEIDGEDNPPCWVADKAIWKRAKKISRKSFKEVRWPFVTWLYLNRLKGTKKDC